MPIAFKMMSIFFFIIEMNLTIWTEKKFLSLAYYYATLWCTFNTFHLNFNISIIIFKTKYFGDLFNKLINQLKKVSGYIL